MWKSSNFSVTRVLREIISAILDDQNFDISESIQFFRAKMFPNPNSEFFELLKWPILNLEKF